MASAGRYRGFTTAIELARLRETARKDNNYDEADLVRADLTAEGVRVDDKLHLFFTSNGLQGSFSLHQEHSFEEVSYICLEREEARKDNNYKEADRLREYLNKIGVALSDKNHTFIMSDGQKGTYDLRSAPPPPSTGNARPAAPPSRGPPLREARQQVDTRQSRRPEDIRELSREREPTSSVKRSAGTETRFTGYLEAMNLALDREELRKRKDYRGSDQVRDTLAKRGVQVDDATHTFTMGDLTGGYDLQTGVTALEIQYVALEREEARRDRNYAHGDSLRQWLAQLGANLDDKSHTFRLEDGVVGSYDLRTWTPVDALCGSPAKRQRL